jgi:hypothetical protein
MIDYIASLLDRMNGLQTALMLCACLAVWVIACAQRNEKNPFDYAQFFRDSTGKLSMGSQISFLCFFVMAWALLFATMNLLKSADDIEAMFYWYLLFGCLFSGAPLVSKFIDQLPTLLALWKGIPPPTPAKQPEIAP